ncbi:TonB-dependent siderophore receptor [Pseudomonas fluorescens]|uniref:TonB-dependent siderophore receptor n=1 Tax=Pseudomonas fluorescens TaxID=294 RepID=UPI000CA15D08|nr:TonB-dependent receptor [Pseudomonas fluorescens]AUM70781.1 TonB-dependent siderophore receptor [Pseudomonas fluorescens]
MASSCNLAKLALAISLVSGMSPVQVVLAATAQEAAAQFNVPAGSLDQTLLAIGQQTGRTISFDPALAKNYRVPAVTGLLSTEQAIAQALRSTDLRLGITGNGTLTIERAPQAAVAPAATNNDAVLPRITVSSSTENEDAEVYNPNNATGAMRGNTSIQETPRSVQVISNKLLTDRQASSLEDALRSSGGVTTWQNNRGVNSYFIRGFSVANTSTNGVADVGAGATPIEGLDRVEVIKGPDSIMTGSAGSSGSINLVRKAPITTPLHQLRVDVTSKGEFQQALDLGGALSDDKQFSYRLNLIHMTANESEPDYNGGRRDYIAPVIRWKDDDTSLTIGAEFQGRRGTPGAATYFYQGKIQKLSNYRITGKDDRITGNTKTGYYEFSHNFTDNLTFESKATYTREEDQIHLWEPGGAGGAPAYGPNGLIRSRGLQSGSNTDSFNTQNNIIYTLTTGILEQKLLAGLDYQHYTTTAFDTANRASASGNLNLGHDFDLPEFSYTSPNYYRSGSYVQTQKGLLLQDLVKVGDKTHVMLAARRTLYNANSTIYVPDLPDYPANLRGTSSQEDFKNSKWVPSYGISYDITPDVTVYANHYKGFQANNVADNATGAPLPPRQSDSKEAGVKVKFNDDALTLTSAIFQMEETGVPVSDGFGRTIGNQGRKSKGVDFDLAGEIFPGWAINASYTYSDFAEPSAPRARNPAFSDATQTVGQPKHSGSVWTSYELLEGTFRGLGAGVGVNAYSSTVNGYASGYNYFTLPGGAQTDASIFYRQKDWSLTLGVKNIFDRTLYSYTATPSYIGVRPERTTRLTATYNF